MRHFTDVAMWSTRRPKLELFNVALPQAVAFAELLEKPVNEVHGVLLAG